MTSFCITSYLKASKFVVFSILLACTWNNITEHKIYFNIQWSATSSSGQPARSQSGIYFHPVHNYYICVSSISVELSGGAWGGTVASAALPHDAQVSRLPARWGQFSWRWLRSLYRPQPQVCQPPAHQPLALQHGTTLHSWTSGADSPRSTQVHTPPPRRVGNRDRRPYLRAEGGGRLVVRRWVIAHSSILCGPNKFFK